MPQNCLSTIGQPNGLKFNMLITFFHLNAFFPLHLSETVVEYIYNKKLGV